jgi:FkbM family methyltransferase
MSPIKRIFQKPALQNGIISAKKLWYLSRGEPVQYGPHKLRYVPGTRPIRLKYIDSPDVVARNDAKQIDFFLKRVQPGQFILDIGGNVGQYAVLFSALVAPAGKVITFEPDPLHRITLRRNLELNRCSDRVTIEDLALSDTNGTHTFFSRNDQMSSLVRTGLGTNAAAPDVKQQIVSTARLDDYIKLKNLGLADWVKIDTEGAEINILRGAGVLLRSSAVIVCELHPYAWKELGTSYEELLGLIKDSGRKIRYLDESQTIENGPVHGCVIIS